MTDDATQAPLSEGIRINKYLASCGYESRRKADQLIAEGAVEINGKRVEAPGARVMPGDYVKVNGKRALPKEEISILLNKPRGFVCSRDAQGSEGTVYDLLPAKYRFVNYVGRLDADSEGLLILTNKGALNQRLGHPTGGIEKEYWVTLNQPYENSVLLQLLKGVRIPEGQAKAKYISRLSARRACVVLEQGLKRQVRQMFACLGFRVRKLVRVRIGSLWGGDLAPGHAMLLTEEQEKLAGTNPAPRKGMISAAQAFPSSGSLSQEQIDKALDEKAARKALEEETDYVFNPADFETEEEAEPAAFRSWDDDDDEAYSPSAPKRSRSREGDRPAFRGRSPRDREERFERRGSRFSGERRPRREGSFGDKRRPRWGEERDERAPRHFGDNRRHGGGERGFRKFADRREGEEREPRRFRRESGSWGDSDSRRSYGSRGGRSYRGGASRSSAPGSRQGSRHSAYGATRRSSAPRRGGKRF